MSRFLTINRRLYSMRSLKCVNKFERKVGSLHYELSRQSSVRSLSQIDSVFATTEQLETQLKDGKQSGGQTSELLKKLLLAYIQNANQLKSDQRNDPSIYNRLKQLAEEVENCDSGAKDNLYSALMQFFTESEDLDTALAMKDKISAFFRLHSFKVINLATLLIKKGKTNAALNLIEEQRDSQLRGVMKSFRDKRQDFKRLRDESINRLLNTMIDKGVDTELIRKAFKICVELNLNNVNKSISEPLIKMHLINRDFSSALKEFVFCANTYRTLPMSLELMRIFIETNDKKSLNIVIEKSVETVGPFTTALDLAAAYLYNGSEEMAKQEMGRINRIQHKRVEAVCDKFIGDNKLDELKQFIQLWQSKEGVDSERLSQLLAKAYRNAGQNEKAEQITNGINN